MLKDRFDLYLSEDDIELMFLYLNPKFGEKSEIESCITIVHQSAREKSLSDEDLGNVPISLIDGDNSFSSMLLPK